MKKEKYLKNTQSPRINLKIRLHETLRIVTENINIKYERDGHGQSKSLAVIFWVKVSFHTLKQATCACICKIFENHFSWKRVCYTPHP